MADIQHEEFERWMHLLRGDVQAIHARLDQLNGRTRTNEQQIAVLTDRSASEGRDAQKGGMLAGGVVTAIAAAIELARHWFAK